MSSDMAISSSRRDRQRGNTVGEPSTTSPRRCIMHRMHPTHDNVPAPASAATRNVVESILALLAGVPPSAEYRNSNPPRRAQAIAHSAATKAALTAAGLALPVGPLGWVTVVPELMAVWRIQAQMVADIAAAHGRSAGLTREHMIFCLFRHAMSQGLRDLVVRVGERALLQRPALVAMQSAVRRIGVRVTQRTAANGIGRCLPVVGALGVGAYAYFDTAQVARTAIGLFEGDGPRDDLLS
jgi:hypothetical protein